jgi:hypothetical protein
MNQAVPAGRTSRCVFKELHGGGAVVRELRLRKGLATGFCRLIYERRRSGYLGANSSKGR